MSGSKYQWEITHSDKKLSDKVEKRAKKEGRSRSNLLLMAVKKGLGVK